MERIYRKVILIDKDDKGRLIARTFKELKVIEADGQRIIGDDRPLSINTPNPHILQRFRCSPGRIQILADDIPSNGGSYIKQNPYEFLRETIDHHSLDDYPYKEESD